MKLKVTPSPTFACQLKNRSGNAHCSIAVLCRSGLGHIAEHCLSERDRPVVEFLAPIIVEVGRRLSGIIPQELAGNLKAIAVFECGFRKSVALKRSAEWVEAVEVLTGTNN